MRAQLLSIEEYGELRVRLSNGNELACDFLQTSEAPSLRLSPGDAVLVSCASDSPRGVVVGRIGSYRAPALQKQLTIEATEVLTLKCGEVSIDLRAADGKMMLRGDDVLLRAKGMQRIKAGSVNIN
jgi:translation initiation factor IF-1